MPGILKILILSLFMAPADHPIHISKCQVEHLRESKGLQITLHVFIDDLEMAIEKEGLATELNLGKPSEKQNADEAIANYITSHLKLSQGRKTIPIQFKSKRMSDDGMAFWCFLETAAVPKLKNIKVEYSLLMDLYDDQKNIFNIISQDLEEQYHLFKDRDQQFIVNF